MKVRAALGCLLLSAVLSSALSGCSSTLDSLGGDTASDAGSSGGDGVTRRTVTGPSNYVNTFQVLLGQDPNDINIKIELAFAQLFHPDPADAATQAIYYEQSDNQALIYDSLHTDVRTEGMGLAMLITVELDHQDEFDRLWRYSKAHLGGSGSAKGYFTSFCDDDTATPCLDSYGMQQFVLALLLANGRWQQADSDSSYAKDALALLDLLQHGIGGTFDAKTHLVREQPSLAPTDYTRSSLEMPASYWYWWQATGNSFWNDAARDARAHLALAAHPLTGLWPTRSYFNGSTPAGSPGFTAQGYRTQLNLALDALWGTASADQSELASRVLDFFYGKGLDSYGKTFSVDGTSLDDSGRAQGLISVNGALAVAAPSNAHRTAFVQAVWDQPIPDGDFRYYDGLLYMMSMLVLSGRMQVY